MKNSFLRLLIAIPLSCIIISAHAQKSGSWSETKYGFRAGVNLGSMAGLSDLTANMKAGYSLGFLLNFRSGRLISSSQEILFSNKGFTSQLANGDKLEYSINYIDIPWTVNVHIMDNFTVYLGPQVSFLVSGSTSVPVKKDDPIALDGLSKIDLSVAGGVEYMLPSRIFFGLRF
ncbi:MAG: PorT family protein, partial [Cytophagales bacterium]|nr:PorT family protein [Cytophagales bacterium]